MPVTPLCPALRTAALASCVAALLWPVAAVGAPARGPQPGDEVVAAEMARERAARAEGGSAAARDRRHASRRAFHGLGRAGALDALRARHPEWVLVPAWRAFALPDGHEIVGYEDAFTARVAAPDGSDGRFVVSTVPLRATDDQGRTRPVDLSLEAGADAFRPVNPLARVRLSRRLGEGLALSDVGLTVRPAVDAQPDPVLEGDTLFWANALTDADVVVRPGVGGFSVNVQVRSEDSPEQYALDLEPPAGTTLHPVAAGVELRRGDEVLATITAPLAWDADGRPVELSWRLDGHRLVIDVPHRRGDYAYPLLVDPDVVETFEWERYGAGDGYGNWAGWFYGGSGPFAPDSNGYNVHAFQGNGWLGTGLYIRNLGTTYYYTAGNAGWWGWRAGIARLRQVEFNLFDQDAVNGTCTELGITGANGWRSRWENCGVYHNQYLRAFSGQPNDEVVFKVHAVPWSGNRNYFAAQLGVVYLHLTDGDKPSLASGLPDGWVDWDAARTLDLWAVDPSLGISEMSVSAPGWSAPKVIGPQTYSRCPRTYMCAHGHATDGTTPNWKDGTSTPNVTVDTMSEGVNTIQVTAKDPGAAGAPGNQQTSANTPTVTGQGLRAEYYDNNDLTNLKVTRRDAQVNFNWGTGSPDGSVGIDTYSARWTGYVTAPETGRYGFETNTDDGVRLWIDNTPAARPAGERLWNLNGTRYLGGVKAVNEPVIDKWRDQGPTRYSENVWLEQGKRYRIVMEYYEESGGAVAELRWRLPSSSTFALVPSSRLSPPGGWTLRLDRSPPTLDPSGELYEQRDVTTPEGDTSHGYVAHDAAVRATVTDGSTASNASRRSGIASIEMLVDGRRLSPDHLYTGTCSPECPQSANPEFLLRRADVGDGPHVITLIARDRLANPTGTVPDRHTTVRTFTVQFGSEPDSESSTDPSPAPGDPSPPPDDPRVGDRTPFLTETQRSETRSFIDAQANSPLTDLNRLLGGSLNYTYEEIGALTQGSQPDGRPSVSGRFAYLRMNAPRVVDTQVPCFETWPDTGLPAPYRAHVTAPAMVDAMVMVNGTATQVLCAEPGIDTTPMTWTPLPNQNVPPPPPPGA